MWEWQIVRYKVDIIPAEIVQPDGLLDAGSGEDDVKDTSTASLEPVSNSNNAGV
jgi:hypothetical protein